MRRAAAWAGGIGLTAAVGTLGFASWPLSTQRVADRLGGASAPLRLGLPEAVTFRALPWPSLSIESARLDGADGAVRVTAPGARLDLSVSQLVQGRFAPVRARLANPILTLDLDRAPFAGPEVGLPGRKRQPLCAPLDGPQPDRRRAAGHEPQTWARHHDREHSGPARRALATRAPAVQPFGRLARYAVCGFRLARQSRTRRRGEGRAPSSWRWPPPSPRSLSRAPLSAARPQASPATPPSRFPR